MVYIKKKKQNIFGREKRIFSINSFIDACFLKLPDKSVIIKNLLYRLFVISALCNPDCGVGGVCGYNNTFSKMMCTCLPGYHGEACDLGMDLSLQPH